MRVKRVSATTGAVLTVTNNSRSTPFSSFAIALESMVSIPSAALFRPSYLVPATHIPKLARSSEQETYAIQDTPELVLQHYGRFLPQDNAVLAAGILNQVREAA